jgi:hypothetical protein
LATLACAFQGKDSFFFHYVLPSLKGAQEAIAAADSAAIHR